MDHLVLEGVRPYDGRYEFDLATRDLNTREWGWIKRFAGYLPLTVDEGMSGGDPELFSVFAVIALERAGRIDRRDVAEVYEQICEAPFGSTIRLEGAPGSDMEEDDAGPPAPSSSESASSSGSDSKTSSVTSLASPSSSGPSGLDASESALRRSAI